MAEGENPSSRTGRTSNGQTGNFMETDEKQAPKNTTYNVTEDAFLRLNISGRRYRLLKRTIVRKEEEAKDRRRRWSSHLATTTVSDEISTDQNCNAPKVPDSKDKKTMSIMPTITDQCADRRSLLFRLIDPQIPLNEKVWMLKKFRKKRVQNLNFRIALCSGYVSSTKEFYFERSTTLFDLILDYYRSVGRRSCPPDDFTATLHSPSHICPESFVAELEFWGLQLTTLIAGCCCCCFDRFQHLIWEDQRGQKHRQNQEEFIPRHYSCSETDPTWISDHPHLINYPSSGGSQTFSSAAQNTAAQLLLSNGWTGSPTKPRLLTINFSVNNWMNGGSLVDLETGSSGLDPVDKQSTDDQFTDVWFGKARRVAFNFIEDPSSNKPAKMFSLISVAVVMISVLDLIIASLPACQIPSDDNSDREPTPHWTLVYTEIGCIVSFTSEYFIRLAITARKWDFLGEQQNQIDLLSVLPFYVEIGLDMSGISMENWSNVRGALLALRILRVLRVARLFKLAKYSGGLQSVGQTLKASYREIGMLMLFLSTTIVLFSTTVYFLEKDVDETKFTSIPISFWWCIITMTTVGYGDMTPVSLGGKLVASLTSVSGVIVLAFPITIIVENFNRNYRMDSSVPAEAERKRAVP